MMNLRRGFGLRSYGWLRAGKCAQGRAVYSCGHCGHDAWMHRARLGSVNGSPLFFSLFFLCSSRSTGMNAAFHKHLNHGVSMADGKDSSPELMCTSEPE
jgi:hypothetical protein